MPSAVGMAPKMTKNQMRRAKKKEQKKTQQVSPVQHEIRNNEKLTLSQVTPTPEPEKIPEAVQEPAAAPAKTEEEDEDDILKPEIAPLDISEDDPNYAMYKDIMDKFGTSAEEEEAAKEANAGEKGEVFFDDDDDIPDEEEEGDKEQKLSKKKRKERDKLSVAELKALVQKPELVDWTDTSASDPRLLVHIKSYRNVVPVPSHWSLKREYLSSKRGVEKAPFALPKFIQETGIAEMRDAVLEKQNEASLKQKQRERVQPKMGKLDIDYQKLYEAFFVRQTKPELTRYGEVYYEGKEYETNLKHLRPGELSDELKEALNIPPGAPPPWLINQQRFGPPPSYPSLKIPGLNAPPPPGGAWGFHPGGYGKPPVDEFNRPLYGGDIFGVLQPQVNNQAGEPIERTLWGELQAPEEESEEEESEDEEEEGDEEDIGAGLQTPSGLETPGGMASTVPSEYPGDMSVGGDFDLRKQKRGTETEESSAPRSAYTVIPERQIRAEGFFGGERAYDVRGAQNAHLPVLGQEDESRKRKKPGDVDVALNPDSLLSEDGISKEELQRTYEQSKKVEKGAWDQEDLSDMIAQESRKRQKRDEEKRGEKRERSYRF
jgi:splicing factor 3B subunit 2